MYALLITEDADESAIFSMVLQRAGLAVTSARLLERAMEHWSERPADLIFLSLSDPPPPEQVRQVRTDTLVPLVMKLPSVDEISHYELLKLGADLVIAPPFSAKVLIAQIGVLMRRSGSVPAFSLPTLSAPGLSLDPANRAVEVDGKPTQRLTHLEFRLLYTLMTNRDQVVPTETIVDRVWGYTGQGDRDLVRGLVSRLRNKIEVEPHRPCYIITVAGIGYQFKKEEG
jgi:DNA-binding response OmpR family regulator